MLKNMIIVVLIIITTINIIIINDKGNREEKEREREPERAIMYNYSVVECGKKQTIFKNLKIFCSIL